MNGMTISAKNEMVAYLQANEDVMRAFVQGIPEKKPVDGKLLLTLYQLYLGGITSSTELKRIVDTDLSTAVITDRIQSLDKAILTARDWRFGLRDSLWKFTKATRVKTIECIENGDIRPGNGGLLAGRFRELCLFVNRDPEPFIKMEAQYRANKATAKKNAAQSRKIQQCIVFLEECGYEVRKRDS